MMKSMKLMCAAALLAGVVAAPAFAQMEKGGMMSSGSSMKMFKMDQKKMTKCNAMSHDMMMKNAGCTKMMKMHPDMMKGG